MLLPCPPDPNRLPCYAGQHYRHSREIRHELTPKFGYLPSWRFLLTALLFVQKDLCLLLNAYVLLYIPLFCRPYSGVRVFSDFPSDHFQHFFVPAFSLLVHRTLYLHDLIVSLSYNSILSRTTCRAMLAQELAHRNHHTRLPTQMIPDFYGEHSEMVNSAWSLSVLFCAG